MTPEKIAKLMTLVFALILIFSGYKVAMTLRAHHESRVEERTQQVAKLENRIDWLCSRNPQWRLCNG